MEIGLYIWKLKNNLALALVMFLFLGCNNSKTQEHIKYIPNLNEIKNGFLVCRLGDGYFSKYFKNYASKEKIYSHIGIVSRENDTLYVYHTEASELTGVGFTKKEKLTSFLNGIKVYDFFEFSSTDSTKKEIVNNIKSYYAKKTPFDLNFDSFNDNEVYCTELIAISINKAMRKTVITPSLFLNGRQLFALDDIYLNKYVKKITFSNNENKNCENYSYLRSQQNL